MLEVEIVRSPGGATTCRLQGELRSDATEVVRSLAPLLGHGSTLTVDVQDVSAHDRSGVAALVGLLRLARRTTSRVELRGASGALDKVLQREGVERVAPAGPATPRLTRSEGRSPSRVHGSAR